MDEFDKARFDLMRDRITMLQERLALRETQLEILRDDIRRLTSPPPRPSATPLFVSEHEEDIMFAREAQAVSIAEAEDMLRELDFENTQLTLDEPDSDLALY